MKTLRILLLTTLAMSFLAGCGGNSEDAEWEADILKAKCEIGRVSAEFRLAADDWLMTA